MDWLKHWTAQIQAQLAGLTISQKMLMASLTALIGAALFIVALYAGRPEMIPLIDQPSTPGERATITGYLQSQGIVFKVEGDRVWVTADRRLDALAGLQSNELLPSDTSEGFAAMIARQTWWQTSAQNEQLYNVALQNELSGIITRMRGVARAKVIISRPQDTGFSATHRSPSASINVEMSTGGTLNQKTAEAMAGLVAGAVAEMKPEHVTVIDAMAGRQFRVRDGQEMVPGDFLELVVTQERVFREKIAAALGYIPNVIVAVNVELSAQRRQVDSTQYNTDGSLELARTIRNRSQTNIERTVAGEPGVRANLSMDIAGSSSGGSEQNTEENDSEFDTFAGVTHEKIFDPGGVPTRVSATINVPRSYFVTIYKQRRPDADGEPTDADLEPLYQENLDRIKRQVEPLLTMRDAGRVVVDVYPDAAPALALAGATGGGMGAGAAGELMGGGVMRLVGLSALALTALMAMFLMIRKANQTTPMPSATELAGLPPQFADGNELAGEAGELDAALPGIELNDDQIASRKVQEQVADMVRKSPSEAASVLKQWLKNEQ